MAYLLRSLIIIMTLAILVTTASAHGWIDLGYGHIRLGIIAYLLTIFVQAFVMFYFIGVSRFTQNIYTALVTEQNLDELFDAPPADLKPYLEATKKFVQDTQRSKRQTIPWCILIVIIGMVGFLLGGAHDTNMVEKTTHSGVVYGFIAATIIGFFRQWYYLKVSHLVLRKVKGLFEIPDAQM